MKILYISDVPGWCFHKTALALQKYGKHTYDIRFGRANKYRTAFKDTNSYDLIIYPVDVRPDYILKRNPAAHKLIVMIRSDVFKLCKKGREKFYLDRGLVKSKVKAFMIANEKLYDKFKNLHDIPCYLAPGGVDTELFEEGDRADSQVYRVGWAGSRDNFGKERRGIPLIEQACEELGYKWVPAYREEKWRTSQEMVDYYNNDIDVYIDLWIGSGRQNGILEAAACGLPAVSCNVGIAPELSKHGLILCERNVKSVSAALLRATRENLERGLQKHVLEEWNWKKHVGYWEEMFEEVATCL